MRSGAQAAALSAGSGLAQTSLRFYEVTLRGCERVLGADHPQTLATRHDLAGAHLAAGDVDAAIGLYEATLAKREAVLGVDHPDTEATRDELADATRRRGTAQRDAGSPPSSLTRAANGEAAGTRSAGPAAAREHLAVLPRRAQSALAASGVVPRIRTRATLGLPRPRLPLRGRRGETRPEDARTPLGRLVRTAAVLMLVFGTLVVTDAVVTLFWQEPITAVIAAHNQGRVNHKLDSLLAAGRAREARQRGTRRMIAAAAAALDLQTPSGEPLGQIRIPRIGIKFAIVQGEDEASLERGPGHYPQTPLPGAAGRWTVGIAGHRTTYLAPFRNIDQLRRGDPIFVTMPYARFTYVVERTVIVDPSDQTIFTAVGYNRLALSACNPPFSAAQRIIVYARQTRMAPLVRVERAHRSHHSAIERIWRGVLA